MAHTFDVLEPAKHLRSAIPTPAAATRGKALTVRLPEDALERLKELAVEHERSLAAEVRYLLRRYADDPESFGGLTDH